jgi:hypothetical protein
MDVVIGRLVALRVDEGLPMSNAERAPGSAPSRRPRQPNPRHCGPVHVSHQSRLKGFLSVMYQSSVFTTSVLDGYFARTSFCQ